MSLFYRLAYRVGFTPWERADVSRGAHFDALLESEPLMAHAVVTALSSSDPSVAEENLGVQETLKSMIAGALDGAPVEDIDGVVHVLGLTWFASMLAWVGGRAEVGAMAADMELASRLLLR